MAKKAVTKATEAVAPPPPAPRAETVNNLVKVRLLVSRAGIDFSQNRGDEIEVSASEAESIIAAGQAEAA